jgi:NADH:ubiquinone oxidoreductase subunit K
MINHIALVDVQIVAAILFCLGLAVALTRRNVFLLLMGIELMLNAVNLSFIGFSRGFAGMESLFGQMTPIFIIAIAASEACVGLAMVICIVRGRESLDSDAFADMKE